VGTDCVVNELGVRVVGELPWVTTGRPGTGHDAPAQLTESVNGLRALIGCDHDGGSGGQVLMVTSAVAQEGKTTLAAHLALSTARAGRRTLLIDCDLRRPRLHSVFGLPPGPGLSGVLLRAATPAEAVCPGPVEGLSVLPAGDAIRAVNQAHIAGDLRALLTELRAEYDLILLDCSPVLPVADALTIGRSADGVLLSVRPGTSQLPLVSAACERMAALRLPVLGAVVNGVRSGATSYKYEYTNEVPA
jgi:capsular exopolysaccharide synthesis family protein